MVTIRQARPEEMPRVEQFYRDCNYNGQVTSSMVVFVVEIEEELAGVLRLESEYGHIVLRGMRVLPAYQGQGIGSAMLRAVAEHLGTSPCYCVPYTHLRRFYGQIGFTEVSPNTVPVFLRERVAGYRARGADVTLMFRASAGEVRGLRGEV